MTVPGVNAAAAQASINEQVERLRKIAGQLGGKYTMKIFMPDKESAKLGWFNDGTKRMPPRPILALNEYAQRAALEVAERRFAETLMEKAPNVMSVLIVCANAIRATYVARLATSGGDITLAPLTPRYLARKIRRGLDRRIGRATGAMAEAIRRGQVVVQKA